MAVGVSAFLWTRCGNRVTSAMDSTIGPSCHHNLEGKFNSMHNLNTASRGVLDSEHSIQFSLFTRIYYSLDSYPHHSADQPGFTGDCYLISGQGHMCLDGYGSHVIGVIGEPLTG